MDTIVLTPIGVVRSTRDTRQDDAWDSVEASIEISEAFPPAALDGIEEFSHAEIIFHFDRNDPDAVERGSRHPRGNPLWPRVGIFAQRASARPNRLGATIVRIIGRQGRVLHVAGLDAANGTPVVDIKPVIAEFLPRQPVQQPDWATELMRNYWRRADASEGTHAATAPEAPLVETIAAAFARDLQEFATRVRKWVDPLSEIEFWTRPYPYGNSAGHLVLHLTGNLEYYLGARVAGTGYVRDRDREFADTGRRPKSEVLDAFDRAVARAVSTIRVQTAADWQRPYHAAGSEARTRFAIVLRCTAHLFHHVGQMIYLSKEHERQRSVGARTGTTAGD